MTTHLLPTTSRLVTLLAALMIFPGAAAQDGEVEYTDPGGRFTLEHPGNWTVAGSPGEVELFADPIASSMRFIVHPLEGLPTQDPDTLIELMLEGLLMSHRGVERTETETTTLAGLTMRVIRFSGVSTRPVTVPREGALYLAITRTHLVTADFSVPQAAAAEALPQIEAVLESFALTD